MKKNNVAKNAIVTFLLCILVMCPAPLALLFEGLSFMPATVRDIVGFLGGVNLISLYALPHSFNALILRSSLKKAKCGGKSAALLPAVPLFFGALACIISGIWAVKLTPLYWLVYCLIFAFFYCTVIWLELFPTKTGMGETARESIFITLLFSLHFLAVPLIAGRLNTASNDAYGFGYVISLFSTVPVLFILIGIYMGIKRNKKLAVLPLVGAVFFLISLMITQARSFEITAEELIVVAIYVVLSYVPYISIMCIKKKRDI